MQVRNKIGDFHSVIDRAVAAHICALGTLPPEGKKRHGSLIPARRSSKGLVPFKNAPEQHIIPVWKSESLDPNEVQAEDVELFGFTSPVKMETGFVRQESTAVLWSTASPVVTLGFGNW